MSIALADDPIVIVMSHAIECLWPGRDATGAAYLDNLGIRRACYQAHGFSDEQIKQYDAAAYAREKERRESEHV